MQDNENKTVQNSNQKTKKGNSIIIIIIAVVITLAACGGWLYYKSHHFYSYDKYNAQEQEQEDENSNPEEVIESTVVIEDEDVTLKRMSKDKLNKYTDIDNKTIDTGIYKELSKIIDNAIQQKSINGMSYISDAVKTNGDLLKNQEFKNEFAFAYAKVFYNKDVKYLDDDVTEETGAYWLTENDFKKVYQKVYNEDAPTDLSKYIEDGYYKSGSFTDYSSSDYYRFVETSNDGNKLVAKIYNSEEDCFQELDDNLEDFCKTHGLEIGRLEIEYEKSESNFIFKSISFFTK